MTTGPYFMLGDRNHHVEDHLLATLPSFVHLNGGSDPMQASGALMVRVVDLSQRYESLPANAVFSVNVSDAVSLRSLVRRTSDFVRLEEKIHLFALEKNLNDRFLERTAGLTLSLKRYPVLIDVAAMEQLLVLLQRHPVLKYTPELMAFLDIRDLPYNDNYLHADPLTMMLMQYGICDMIYTKPSLNRSETPSLASSIDTALMKSVSSSSSPIPVTVPHLSVLEEKSSQRVKKSMDDFQLVKVLGKGCMGKVLLARELNTHRLVAIKSISKQWVASHGPLEIAHTKAEQRILAALSTNNHPFLMKLHASFQSAENLFLVLDYVGGGDLATQLAKWGRLGEERSRFYAAEILEGVSELHRLGIIYRDLKPENVLLAPSGHIVLTDFGLSKQFTISQWFSENESNTDESGSKTQTFCGTAEYLACEILLGEPYGFEVDWWSLGTFLYEMLAGITPFWADNHNTMYRRVLEDPLVFPEESVISSTARDLLSGLLTRTPSLRLGYGTNGSERIKAHPFFTCISWPDLIALRVPPPYIPPVTGEMDLQNFDEEFTTMTPRLSTPLSKSRAVHSANSSEDGALSESIQKYFQGYSYVSSFVDRWQWKKNGSMDDVLEMDEKVEAVNIGGGKSGVRDTDCIDSNDMLDFEMED